MCFVYRFSIFFGEEKLDETVKQEDKLEARKNRLCHLILDSDTSSSACFENCPLIVYSNTGSREIPSASLIDDVGWGTALVLPSFL